MRSRAKRACRASVEDLASSSSEFERSSVRSRIGVSCLIPSLRSRLLPSALAGVLAVGSLTFCASGRAAPIVDTQADLVSHPGAIPGGGDASRVQNTSLGVASLGFNAGVSTGLRLADDFTLTQPVVIDSVSVFGYQTGSGTTSTINDLRLQIWNGDPAASGSVVVFGDTTTNRLTASTFTNIYRDAETDVGDTDRPIMRSAAGGLSLALPAGTYWADFQLGGSAGMNVFVPPITKLGLVSPPGANAKQWNGTAWSALDDSSAGTQPQGLAFQVTGVTAPTVTTGAVSATTETTATFNGTVNPGDGATDYHFEYGPTPGLGQATPDAVAQAGTAPVSVVVPVRGLAPGRSYHARLVARNRAGTTVGQTITFTTLRRLTLGPVSVRPRRVRAGRSAVARFSLSERARVLLVVDRLIPGRRRAGRCRPAARSGPRCTAVVRRAVVTLTRGASRAATMRIPARLGGRRLAPGRYRITVTAKDPATGRTAAARRALFTVTR